MSNKIGILTFCDSYNYGAALQAFASYKYLCELGYECIFINYRNKEEKKLYQSISFLSSFSLIANLKRNIKNSILLGCKNGKKGFQDFYEMLPKTRKYSCRTIKRFDEYENVDFVLIGSDQVWNPEICGGKLDLNFWGIFTTKNKISFASSCGSYSYSPGECNEIKKQLKKFIGISVREEYSKEQLLQMGVNNDIQVLTDPVTLISRETWIKIINKKSNIIVPKTKYIVVYFVKTKYEDFYESIDYVKRYSKSKVVLINIYNLKKKGVNYYFRKSTPFDFVNLIANAEYVITDSFHAIVFSTIFHIKFFYTYNDNMVRVENLTKKLNIDSRIIHDKEDTITLINKPIQYENVREYYSDMELKTRGFIENVLK